MRRRVTWHRRAQRDLEQLGLRDPRMAQRIRDRVALYAREGHGDVLKLAGQDDIYRLRIGDWRILFGFDDGGETVVVLRVLPRNERTYQGR